MGAQYDLTAEIAQYLDKHMVVPLLDFQLERNVRVAFTKRRKKREDLTPR